jgi:HAD superfamily hydrolase (TIGR01509 family)
LTDEIYKQLVGRSRKDGLQALVDAFGAEFPLQKFQACVQEHEATAFSTSPISKKPGLDALLDFLEARNLPKAVATSTERHRALPTLKSAGLLQRFAVVVTGDEVARGKPFPDIFLLAAQCLSVDPATCLVLEDAESGVIAANQAGMQVYMVPDLVIPSHAVRQLAQGVFDSLAHVLRNLEIASINSTREGIDLQSFRTERMAAFPLDRHDGQELFEMHQNPAVMATLGGIKSEAAASQWLNDNLDHWKRHGFGIWIFRDVCDGRFIGRGGIRDVEVGGGREVELGYALLDKDWGMGFAMEMAREILNLGFDRFQLKSIVALIDADNIRSRRVAEKLGFHFERNVTWKGLPAMLYRLRSQNWIRR